MTKNLNAYATAKGYQILKVPVILYLPVFGWLWLPKWLTWDYEYVSPKGCRYTLDGLLFKIKCKRDRRRNKALIMERRKRMNLTSNK